MRRLKHVRSTRCSESFLVVGVFVFNVLVIEHGQPLWQTNFAVLLLFVALTAFRWGALFERNREHAAFTRFADKMPKDVDFERNDSTGEITALITTHGGDLLTVPLPERIHGPQEAMSYVLRELLGIDPE